MLRYVFVFLFCYTECNDGIKKQQELCWIEAKINTARQIKLYFMQI